MHVPKRSLPCLEKGLCSEKKVPPCRMGLGQHQQPARGCNKCSKGRLWSKGAGPLFALAHSVNRCTDELVMRTEHCTSIEPWSESEIVRHHQREMGMEACRV